MRFRCPLLPIVLTGLLLAGVCRAADQADVSPPPPVKAGTLEAQVEELKAQLESLRAENAELREKLAAKEKGAVTRPASRPAGGLETFGLGAGAKLGGYKYLTPAGWTATPPKDNKLSALYRTPDKVAAILVQVKPKGAAPPELQPKYAQSVIQMLKLDFAKSKTEILDPPTIQQDPRFFLRVHERVAVKGEKVADQTHLYLMPGKDVIELTVISTSEASDQVAMTVKLAEDVLLSFKPEK